MMISMIIIIATMIMKIKLILIIVVIIIINSPFEPGDFPLDPPLQVGR